MIALLDDFQIIDDAAAIDLGIEDQHLHAGIESIEIELLRNLVGLAVVKNQAEATDVHGIDRPLDVRTLGKAAQGRKETGSGKQGSDQETHCRSLWRGRFWFVTTQI